MMPGMAENQPAVRLTESIPGRLAGWMLAALWIFSMSAVDTHAFSAFPVCVVLVLVLLLVGVAVMSGHRLVSMSCLGWFSLLLGGYFLVRCLNSYAIVDSWTEIALILGAFVYYVAGIYVAMNKSYRSIFVVLGAALLLNVTALWAVRQPWFCLEWLGRARFTPQGTNAFPTSLLIYKNFAGVFFSIGGSVLLIWAFWCLKGFSRWLCGGVALAAICASFLCSTRAIYLVYPLFLLGMWLLNVIKRIMHDQKLGLWNLFIAFGVVVLGAVIVADLFVGNALLERITGTDSHLRFAIWGAVCEVIPSVPLWGCGANATTWELVPYYSEWQLPNYAHNEYLQAWVDYGLLGLVAVMLVVALHLLQGVRCLAAESVSHERHGIVVLAMLILGSFAAYAIVDFPWHSFALVGMNAFVCGVLAAPFAHHEYQSWFSNRKWADSSRPPVVAVRAQKWPGRLILIALSLGLACVSAWLGMHLYPAWRAQWVYDELSREGIDPQGDARRDFIARLMPLYPSPGLADTYYMLPPYGCDLVEREQLLRTALNANPKQLFTVVMLADVLGARGKYVEAEQLMRKHYVGDSMPYTLLNNWPGYYAYNLLLWGRSEMQQGRHAVAMSMFDYAHRMRKIQSFNFNPVHRMGEQPWKDYGGVKPGKNRVIQMAESDLRLLHHTGVQPDDSWQRPLTPGGRPALYRTYVNQLPR